jgi:hypothetical protein
VFGSTLLALSFRIIWRAPFEAAVPLRIAAACALTDSPSRRLRRRARDPTARVANLANLLASFASASIGVVESLVAKSKGGRTTREIGKTAAREA